MHPKKKKIWRASAQAPTLGAQALTLGAGAPAARMESLEFQVVGCSSTRNYPLEHQTLESKVSVSSHWALRRLEVGARALGDIKFEV